MRLSSLDISIGRVTLLFISNSSQHFFLAVYAVQDQQLAAPGPKCRPQMGDTCPSPISAQSERCEEVVAKATDLPSRLL